MLELVESLRCVLANPRQSAPTATNTILSQGDPLGPSLVALAIHPCIIEVIRVADPGDFDFKAFFLDDGVVAGKAPALQQERGGPCSFCRPEFHAS